MHDQHHATEELDEAKASRPVLKGGGGPQRPSPTQQYGPVFTQLAAATGIDEVRTAYRVPKENAICERFLGSVRRERLDHLLILGEAQLRRVVRDYLAYFNAARPHQGLQQRIPEPREEAALPAGPVRATPVLGGLHHT
jgi:transposase InsO family protein